MKSNFSKLALLLVALTSCDSNSIEINTEKALPTEIELDFTHRYPGVSICHFESYSCDNTTRISFVDNDGLEGEAVYLDGSWMVTQREYDAESFLSRIPRNIIRTYLMTGASDEEYDWDQTYIAEISRAGFDQRQYEFHFMTPYINEVGTESHLSNTIIISEDGSLLTFDHCIYNPSIWFYDMRDSYRCVTERYPAKSILGAVNQVTNHIYYVKDDGTIKTVTTREKRDKFEWEETEYRLALDTSLPEYVETKKQDFAAQYPGLAFFRLSFVEKPKGKYYRLGFGSDMNGYYFDVETE